MRAWWVWVVGCAAVALGVACGHHGDVGGVESSRSVAALTSSEAQAVCEELVRDRQSNRDMTTACTLVGLTAQAFGSSCEEARVECLDSFAKDGSAMIDEEAIQRVCAGASAFDCEGVTVGDLADCSDGIAAAEGQIGCDSVQVDSQANSVGVAAPDDIPACEHLRTECPQALSVLL